MNVNYNCFHFVVADFFKTKTPPHLTDNQSKILIIGLSALGFLTACYLIVKHCCFKAKKLEGRLNDEQSKETDSIAMKEQKNIETESLIQQTDFSYEEEVLDNSDLFLSNENEIEEQILEELFSVRIQKGDKVEVYEGSVISGLLTGQGKITKANLEIWQGEFQKGALNGEGVINFPDGTKLKGSFKNNLLNGSGQMTYSDGQLLDGVFKNGHLNGLGKVIFPKNQTLEGIFTNGQLNGFGKIIWESGEVWEGVFQNDELNGNGKIISSNGEKLWEGVFMDSFAIVNDSNSQLIE